MRSSRKVNKRDEVAMLNAIRQRSYSLNDLKDLQPLIRRIGDARIVMLGESSHGTHEYYTWRSYISKKLITEKGFHFIAVEGDWPDCYQINQFIKDSSAPTSAADVLRAFDRWPTWMWANWEIAALTEWMKKYNAGLSPENKVGFYGLDVYSLWDSMDAILGYLEKHDPEAVAAAHEAYRCFEPHGRDDGQSYVKALQFVPDDCRDEVVALLQKIKERLLVHKTDPENMFSVEQNALITVNAEKYYRAMLTGSADSWNVRDEHMHETLLRLLDLHGPDSKAIVWEHNTHIGDARATDMKDDGMINIGELARDSFNGDVVLVGFGTYEGTVIAGKSWGAKMQVMEVPPSRPGSWEYYLHEAQSTNQLLLMEDFHQVEGMDQYIDHRAIGVVYNPAYERYGNYVPTVVPMRYDAFVYIDQTKALHPLHIHADRSAIPDLYPFGV